MTTGTVKMFDDNRGFGFIKPDGGGTDVFVHVKDLRAGGVSKLEQDDRVEFDVKMGDRGPRADRIRRI